MSDLKRPPDPIYTLRGSGSPVTCLKFQSENLLYSGCMDGTMHTWNMKTKRIVSRLLTHQYHSVQRIEVLPNNSLLTQGRDGKVKIWQSASNLSGFELSGEVRCSNMGFCAGCLVQVNNSLVYASPGVNQSEVDLIQLNTLQTIGKLIPPTDSVGLRQFGMCMAICGTTFPNQDETNILIGYEDGSVALWDIRTLTMVERVKFHTETVMCMGFSARLQKGVTASVDTEIVSWKLESNSLQSKHRTTVVNPGCSALQFRDDGKIVASAGWDKNVRIFGAKSLKPLVVLSYHKENVQSLTFSPENILACGSNDHHISLWDVYR